MKKYVRWIFLSMVIILGGGFLFLFAGKIKPAQDIVWGVGFSQKHAETLGLDWKEVYMALIDDLGVRQMKVSFDWKELEPEKDVLFFEDTDWQIAEAKKRGVQLLVVMGMKTLRWPECHTPEWAKSFSKEQQEKEVLELLQAIVTRYKDSSAVASWQIENEPLLVFGDCPWHDKQFLRQEVDLVRSLDNSHPIVISDSGEFSFWFEAARIGDIVSTTMYRKVWFHEIDRYVEYPLPSTFYGRKAHVIKTIFDKNVIGGELQAEPWGPGKLLYDTTLQEQDKAFNFAQFKKNIEFARKTGIAEHYLWGAEWWYWRKQIAHDDSFWEEARFLFMKSNK